MKIGSFVSLCAVAMMAAPRVHSQLPPEQLMRNATSRLSQLFQQLVHDELGTSQLQNEYSGKVTLSTLNGALREELLSQTTPTDTINRVVQVFDDVINNRTATPSGPNLPDCTVESSTSACCVSCSGSNTDVAGTVAGAFEAAQINGAQFQFGFPDGAVVRYPAFVRDTDVRLQSWYTTATESRPREIVLLVDLLQQGLNPSRATDIRQSAISVIRSFTPDDKVAVVFTERTGMNPCAQALVTATPAHIEDLVLAVIDTSSPPTDRVTAAITQSFSLFTNDPNSDKLLVILADGRVRTSVNVSVAVSAATTGRSNNPNVAVQMYTISTAVATSLPGQLASLPSIPSSQLTTEIGSYYSQLVRANDLSSDLIVTSGFTAIGAPALSITQLWLNNDSVVGVFHAMLPWQSLLQHLANVTTPRPSSYYFVMNQQGTIIYHQLVPVSVIIGLNQSFVLETEPEFGDVVAGVMSGTNSSRSVMKTVLLPLTDAQAGSYIRRSVSSTYYWRRLWTDGSQQQLYVCLLLADEDVSVVTGFTGVNVASIYASSRVRQPILHTSISSENSLAMCGYYCLVSLRAGRVGLQLTTPINVTDNIDNYLSGTGNRPASVPLGTAEEVAIASVVQSVWTRTNPSTDAITSRHLATPTGIYLSYPPVELGSGLRPQLFTWYAAASALPSTEVALSPSSRDLITEQSVYTISSTVRNNVNGQVLAVVSANLTQRSLLEEVNTALGGLCKQDGYDCLIVNSESYFVLQPSGSENTYPEYLANYSDGRPFLAVVRSMLTNMTMEKTGCSDVRDSSTSKRLFYNVKTSTSDVVCITLPTGLYDYWLQHISGTNSILMVLKRKPTFITTPGFFFCAEMCNSCTRESLLASTCICHCKEQPCSSPTLRFPLCPAPVRESVSFSLAATTRLTSSEQPSFCFDQDCCSRDEQSCLLARSCSWCGGSPSGCVPMGTCCPDQREEGAACCNNTNSASLPACFMDRCQLNPQVCPEPVTPSPTLLSSPTLEEPGIDAGTAAIIGGVIGGLFALVLISLLVVFIVWYQFCRAPEPDEPTKQKGVFNFTDIKPSAVNTTAVELEKNNTPSPNGESEKPIIPEDAKVDTAINSVV